MLASGFKIADYEEFVRIIMGANSSAGINKNIMDNTVGYLELKELKKNIEKLDNKNKKKVFLLHHHNDKDVGGFCNENKIDLLLHGDKHISYKKRSKQIKSMQIFGAHQQQSMRNIIL